jgi:hypothetical protein
MLKRYIIQLLISIDQLFNVLLFGYADETLSSRAWRAYEKGKIFGKIFRPTIDFIFFFEKNHCYEAYLFERKRMQQPPELRD